MRIVQAFLTKNPCYNTDRNIVVKGLMLHSVGCGVQTAEHFLSLWNNEKFDRACVHAFIDGNDGTIYQTLPWTHRGWHAGGMANNTHIGIEMCEYSGLKYAGDTAFVCDDPESATMVAKTTYDAAAELFAKLSIEFHLDPLKDGVIISHCEGHLKGVATDHPDPEHLWKQLNLYYSMDTFRQAVFAEMKRRLEIAK